MDYIYMIFRIDKEYDDFYGSHSEIVSFRGIRRGLGDLFTDPSRSDELLTREDGSVHAYLRHSDREVEYVAVRLPSEEGVGPEFAIQLFESCH